MTLLELVKDLNVTIVVLFTLLYLYQGFYVVVGLVRRRWTDRHQPEKLHRFAAIVSARNEEVVIGELLESLRKQDYPAELLDLYVVADNCTDGTAEVARRAGAFVYERFDQSKKGKGYAMDMNRTFDRGYDAVTCYRNSKNFGTNWISAGYSIWFLREARFLNFPRTLLGTNCHVSGTGFLVSAQVIRENGGWPFHLLTEDIQFSVDCAIRGRRIGYCDKAVVYDEQPTTFRQSWDQRLRWSKGFYQVDRAYTLPLLKGCLRWGHKGTSCYDMFATVAPGMLLTLFIILFNGVVLAACLTQPTHMAARIIHECLGFIGSNLWNFYLGLLAYGMLTVLSEWRHISAAPMQKIGYVFTFPVFMFTYIPISIAALVRKVEWKPIYHTAAKKLNELG